MSRLNRKKKESVVTTAPVYTSGLPKPAHPALRYKSHRSVKHDHLRHYTEVIPFESAEGESAEGKKEDEIKNKEDEISTLKRVLAEEKGEREAEEYKNKTWYNKLGSVVSSAIGLNVEKETDALILLKKQLLGLEKQNNVLNGNLDQRKQEHLKSGPLGMETAKFLDQCLKINGIKTKFTEDSGKEINYPCYASGGNYEYAKRVVENKRHGDSDNYDLIFKKDDSEKHGYIFKDYKNGDTVGDGWTPLKPGDIVYHPCVVRAIGAEHAAIYIGCGAVIHLWQDKGRLARIICTSVREAASAAKKCEFLIIDKEAHDDDLGTDIRYKSTNDMLKDALESMYNSIKNKGHGYYGELTNNCHQWVMDIATNKGLPLWIPGKGYTHSMAGELYRTGKPRISTRMNLPAHKKTSRNLQKRRRKAIKTF